MTRTRRRSREPKANPREHIIVSARQGFAHESSLVVSRQIDIARFELQQLDAELAELKAAIAAGNQKRADIEARITGLTLVLERR